MYTSNGCNNYTQSTQAVHGVLKGFEQSWISGMIYENVTVKNNSLKNGGSFIHNATPAKILSDNRYGFRKRKSRERQLILTLHDLTATLQRENKSMLFPGLQLGV